MCKTCDSYRNVCDILRADLARVERERDEARAALAAVARAAERAAKGASAAEALSAGRATAIMQTDPPS
jgi:hypothetical protein